MIIILVQKLSQPVKIAQLLGSSRQLQDGQRSNVDFFAYVKFCTCV